MTGGPADQAAEEVVRTSYGRLVAYVATRTHDVTAAEDALSEALVDALRTWPVDGVPDRPEAWLLTVARRNLIGAARGDDVRTRAATALTPFLAEAEKAMVGAPTFPDERLRLLFACAHPAIDPRAHAPLMLQAVFGLDAARIASAFLVAPATMGQRLVRAKARLRDAGVPFAVPPRSALPDRLDSVLDAIYAAYGSGWDDAAGLDARRRGLADEGVRLARLTVELLADEPEARGLAALVLHCEARRPARRDADGRFVALSAQDPARWSGDLIAEAERHLTAAAALGRLGRFQLEAAIQSVHARRAVTGGTDWTVIGRLYDGLVALAPTTGAIVASAAALAEGGDPAAALARLDDLPAPTVRSYQAHWVVRARALTLLDRPADAADARARAIGLTEDPAVRAHLIDGG